MKIKLLDYLRCPKCKEALKLVDEQVDQSEVREGILVCVECAKDFPVVNYIPRMVDDDNYASTFGYQWNRHAQTLVDKFNGSRITEERFYGCSEWRAEDLDGKRILEAGCGAGRFTEIMLKAGMEVFAFDYSNAVDACLANHGLHPNLHIIQGNIYEIPYEPRTFDRVFCYGVMQHTPDVRQTFRCLAEQVRPGGMITVDVYPDTFKARLHYPRYLLRPLTKRLSPKVLYTLVVAMVAFLLPLSVLLKKIPLVGRYLFPLLPVANYVGDYPLSWAQQREWSIIDTFDWMGCWYDQPQSAETLRNWFAEVEFADIGVKRVGSFVGKGTRPAS
jgi:uncharacterized protein YbaR (Trm112 family)